MANSISNPFTRGMGLRLPAGEPVRSTNPRHEQVRLNGADRTIKVFAVTDGHVDLWDDHRHGRGFVVLPEITWPGAGGYWQTVRLTPELAALNGFTLTLPDLDNYSRSLLDAEPGFGTGYDNRHRI